MGHPILGLVREISGIFVASSNLNSMLYETLALVREKLDYPVIAYARVDQELNKLIHKFSIAKEGMMVPAPGVFSMSPDHGIVGRCYRSGEPVVVSDVTADPDYVEAFEGIKSECAIPIKVGDEVVAIIDIEAPVVNAFGPDDLELFNSIADIISTAIFAFSQLEGQERKTRQLQTAMAAHQVLNSSLSEEELLPAFVGSVMELQPTTCTVYAVEGAQLIPIAHGGEIPGEEKPIELKGTLMKAVVKHGESAWVPEPDLLPQGLFLPPWAQSQLCLPITGLDDVKYVVSLTGRQINAFSEDDRELLDSLVERASQYLIDNNRRQSEAHRLRQLEMMLEVKQILAEKTIEGDVEEVFLNLIRSKLPIPTLRLYDRLGDVMVLSAQTGAESRDTGVQIAVEEGVVGWVVRRGESALVGDMSTDPRARDGEKGSRIVLPIRPPGSGQVKCALVAAHPEADEFGSQEVATLELMGAVFADFRYLMGGWQDKPVNS